MDFKDYFADKKITVMGLGLLGRQIGDVAYMAEAGAELIVTDLKSAEQLATALEQLKQYPNVTYVLGEHREEDFVDRDYILVAPSVPLDSKHLQIARDNNIPLKQSAAWFAELSKIPIIGITGTRGKSTVTHMIHHMLSQITGEEVLLGGNVRGLSNLQLLKQIKEDSLCVMELDSWQLQGWGWSHMSPQVAVFTNFMEDHLNYYMNEGITKEEAMERYFADKANIFRYQEDSGVLVTTPEVFERAKQLKGVTLGQEVILADASIIPEDALLAMPGEHNRLNAALAVEVLKALSLTDDEIWPALATFPGVEGRLQYVGAHDQIAIFNDNNATTPAATTRALQAVGEAGKQNIILIAGGADKGIDPAELLEAIPHYCKQVILLAGTGTDRLQPELQHTNVNISIMIAQSMPEAVEAGLAAGQPGDILLFSPGYASFGMFKNEYERNDAFLAAVQQQIYTAEL